MYVRMGVKRPLEEENLPELSFEQPKQHDSNKKLILVTGDFPSHQTVPIVNSSGQTKNKFSELDPNGIESGGNGAFIVDKELEASVPFYLATTTTSSSSCSSSSRGGHVGDQDFSRNYSVPGFINLAIPRLPPEQYEDPYVYLLNCPPGKEVLVGPDHQVEVPEWDPSASGKNFSGYSNFIEDELEQKLMGACMIPSPGLKDLSIDCYAVGRGRTDCVCLDMGSVRCVQQHVREAREKLRYTIGDETFMKLGFYEMGEEVARRWSTEDEQLFHKVVVSNPASLGRDFWKDLAAVFPTRTKKEFVSYYFNVFMLRKRGFQNRSYLLRIDSDDDEDLKIARVHHPSSQSLLVEAGDDLHHSHGDFHHHVHVGGDEDSDVESLSDQDLDAGWVDGYWYVSEPEIVCRDDNHETCDGINPKKDDVDDGSPHRPATYGNFPKQDALEIDDQTAQMPVQESEK